MRNDFEARVRQGGAAFLPPDEAKPRRLKLLGFRTALDLALALLTALAGAAAAIICLVFKPVTIVANDALVPAINDTVHYTQGSRDRAKGATWIRKRAALLTATPGVLTLNEDELNTWFAASTHTRPSRRAGITAAPVQLDFHIANGTLQVASPVSLDTPFGTANLIVQMRGTFERIPANSATGMPSVIMFIPREAFAGSLALHRIPGATQHIMDTLLESQTPPPEALSAWRKINRVSISGRELHISISTSNTTAE